MKSEESNWKLALTVGGFGLSVAGLYLLRRSRVRAWIDLARIDHLKNRSVQGQTVLITGANTGLGFETAEEFSRRGAANVILACRDTTKGNEAARKIRDLTGNTSVECLQLNLASLESVRQFAKEFCDKYESLDILVCNAGVWIPMDRGEKTEDGYEIHFGVNHLSHFLLTHLLLGRLRQSTFGGRVILVSSSLMAQGKIDMESQDFVYQGRKEDEGARRKNRASAPTGYTDTKRMNALFAKTLAKRLEAEDGNQVMAFSVCPGWCKTDLARYLNLTTLKKLLITPIAFLFMRSASQGSHNIVYLGMEDQEKLKSGGFYRDGIVVEKEDEKLDQMTDVGDKLWTLSEQLTGLK